MASVLDQVRDKLTIAGYDIVETRDFPHGQQLRCSGGEVVCVYHTGKVVAQGRNAGAVKGLFEANPLPKPGAVVKPKAAVVETVRADLVEEEFKPRFPPGWSWEPWDGVTAPF